MLDPLEKVHELEQRIEHLPQHVKADVLRTLAVLVPAVMELAAKALVSALQSKADELDHA